MDSFRLIIVSSESGHIEEVTFVDKDNDDAAEDWTTPGTTSVDFDGIIEADLPSGFPLEYILRRK